MALFLQDLLTVIHKVSLKFQEDNSVVADISVFIKTMASRIMSLEKRYVNTILVSVSFHLSDFEKKMHSSTNFFAYTNEPFLHNFRLVILLLLVLQHKTHTS